MPADPTLEQAEFSLQGQPDDTVTVGVLADTHIPDRVNNLHPQILPLFRQAGVQQIFHAGDICIPAVLAELEGIAPVTAVRGNRDWILRRSLPWTRRLIISDVPVALVHGHGNLRDYLWDKWQYLRFGYHLKRYIPQLERPYPDARVIIFGHTHRPEVVWHQGRLLFNPGSACIAQPEPHFPTVGLLHFHAGGKVQAEVVQLTGAQLIKRRWVAFGDQF